MDASAHHDRREPPAQAGARPLSLLAVLRLVLAPLLLAGLLTALCGVFAGSGLGLFFGGVAAATMLVPFLVLADEARIARWLVWAAVADGVGLTWLMGVFSDSATLPQWLACYLVLASYCLALAGVATLLARLGRQASLAGAVTVLLALAWLTWPIWAAPWLTGPHGQAAVDWLVPAHPLFAINGVLQQSLGVWTEHSIAYGLTNLNQDVPYSLPTSVLPSVVVHLLFGTLLLLPPRRGAGR